MCFENQSIMLKNAISTDKAQSFILPLIFYVNDKTPFIVNIVAAYPFQFKHFSKNRSARIFK